VIILPTTAVAAFVTTPNQVFVLHAVNILVLMVVFWFLNG
jgi:hypothetical protein